MENPIDTRFVTADDSNASGVSWGAVIAGAFVTAAFSLALLALGTGVGLSSASPWAIDESASRIGWIAILWLVLIQLIACSMGGYLAGRLRTKWSNVHTHEVYFRDTAHGFLVWAVSLVLTAAFLTSAAASMLGKSSRSGGVSSAQSRETLGSEGYFVDSLLRSSSPSTSPDTPALRAEVGAIFAHALKEGNLPQGDKAYLAQVVTARSGASESVAEARVDDAFEQTRQAVDTGRKAIAHSMYWTFLALLVGAFSASFVATMGGKQRDAALTISKNPN